MSDNDFGSLIKGLREKKGLKQAELAELVGVSSPYVSQVEVGRRIPAEDLCIRFAKALDYDARDLIIQARTAKSPETIEATRLLAGEPHKKGGERVEHPRLKEVRKKLHHLQLILPEDRYERLLNTILGVLEPYTNKNSVERKK